MLLAVAKREARSGRKTRFEGVLTQGSSPVSRATAGLHRFYSYGVSQFGFAILDLAKKVKHVFWSCGGVFAERAGCKSVRVILGS